MIEFRLKEYTEAGKMEENSGKIENPLKSFLFLKLNQK